MNLGTKIRELRKNKRLTQEELAAKLHVSPQAVSKWESAVCQPDIAQLPVLANFFGVSLDTLFGRDASEVERKIDAIIKEHESCFWSDREKCEPLLTNALKEFPDNERLMIELAELYMSEAPEKALPIAETLANTADDFLIEGRAKRLLAKLCTDAGRNSDALRVVESLPALGSLDVNDRLRVGAGQLSGDDRLRFANDLKWQTVQDLFVTCADEGSGYLQTGQPEAALESFGKERAIIELFMLSDEICLESYKWSGTRANHWGACLSEALCLFRLGRDNEAKEKLDRAKYILRRSNVSRDGTDYFAAEPEKFLTPFREAYEAKGLCEFLPL